MRIKRKGSTRADVFTDSIGDVSMLLLVFFVVTAVIATGRGLDLGMSEAPPNDGAVELLASVDVYVARDGHLEVDNRPMTLGQLLPYVRDRLRANPTKPVILRAHPDATYQGMVCVLDELRRAPEKIGMEIENLVIPTLREQQLYWPEGTAGERAGSGGH